MYQCPRNLKQSRTLFTFAPDVSSRCSIISFPEATASNEITPAPTSRFCTILQLHTSFCLSLYLSLPKLRSKEYFPNSHFEQTFLLKKKTGKQEEKSNETSYNSLFTSKNSFSLTKKQSKTRFHQLCYYSLPLFSKN